MKRFQAKGVLYDSKSEAALSLLLEKYCSFVPQPGENVHVPVGRTTIDFIVEDVFEDVLIEWHPRKKRGKKYRWQKRESPEEYAKGKRNLVMESGLKEELIIISGFKNFYERVLKRFGKDLLLTKLVESFVQLVQ